MKHFLTSSLLTAAFALPTLGLAAKPRGDIPRMMHFAKQNKIILQLNAEQWVDTETALVAVRMTASLKQSELADFHGHVMEQLHRLAQKGDWHITQFNRYQDGAGLESVNVQAKARLPREQAAQIRAKAEKLSRPGETIKVEQIQYTPELATLEAICSSLRQTIYQKAQAELDTLNKQYSHQHYHVGRIDFIGGPEVMRRQPQMMMAAKRATPAMGSASFAVGEKLQQRARVVLVAD